MGRRSAIDPRILRELIHKEPWIVLNAHWASKEYTERTGKVPNIASIHYTLARYGLEWAKESPHFVTKIEEGCNKSWGDHYHNLGPATRLFVDHDIIRAFILDDPFAFMHPGVVHRNYVEKTGMKVAASSIHRVTRKYGLMWAMQSPDWDEDVEEAYRVHCRVQKIPLPEGW